jgi:hypothetical protein
MGDSIQDDQPEVVWQHLDYYVRRHHGELVLVETVLKQIAGEAVDQTEIYTFYYGVDQLPPEWAEAILEQGVDLPDNKSGDFVPPDEIIYLQHIESEDD